MRGECDNSTGCQRKEMFMAARIAIDDNRLMTGPLKMLTGYYAVAEASSAGRTRCCEVYKPAWSCFDINCLTRTACVWLETHGRSRPPTCYERLLTGEMEHSHGARCTSVPWLPGVVDRRRRASSHETGSCGESYRPGDGARPGGACRMRTGSEVRTRWRTSRRRQRGRLTSARLVECVLLPGSAG
jgi:hypothetical protein